MRNILAIDFGTSNSTVGYCSTEGPQLIPIENGFLTIPSAIFFNLEEGRVQFGRDAIKAYTNHYEGRLLRSLKSILGSDLVDESTLIGNESIAFREIVAQFIWHLKTVAEEKTQCEFKEIVLGRPVRFVDDDDEKDARAQYQLGAIANACGFESVHFQYEPIAAALDYESTVNREELALIADIGGGTSDFTIIKVSPTSRLKSNRLDDVLANSGVHVGGTDFDKALSLAQVMQHLGYKTKLRERPTIELPSAPYFDLATWHRIALLYGNETTSFLRDMHLIAARPDLVHRLIRVVREQTGYHLAGDVERAKIELSDQEESLAAFSYIDEGLAITFDRHQFNLATAELREKISLCIERCMAMAGVGPGDIDTLFMTGGTSGIPAVRSCCVAAAPNARLVEGDRFGSVGLGLTIDAVIRSKDLASRTKQ
jgi:hypothetical chaperone protein